MSFGTGDIDSFINCYMSILQKAVLTASIRPLVRFSKPGTINNSKVPDTAGRKLRERRQAIIKCYAFYANATGRRTQAIAKRYTFHANTTRRRTQEVAKCYAFHTSAVKYGYNIMASL